MLNLQNKINENVKCTKLEITIMIQFIDKENLIVLIRSEDKAAGKPEYSLICIKFHFV